MPSEFDGRVAVVTGAAGGIGRAVVELLASAGVAVAVTDVDATAAAVLARDVVASGGIADAFHLDVTDPIAVTATVQAVVDRWGRIDILHNNAADMASLSSDSDAVSMDLSVWDRVFAVNVRGPLVMCQAVIPVMQRQGNGSIVNTVSIAGILPTDGVRLAYSCSKAALIMLTKHVAGSFGKQGIRCNAVAPGMILTVEKEHEVGSDYVAANVSKFMTPYAGKPIDIAQVVLFLTDDASRFVTGQIISADGGVLAHRTDFTPVTST